MNFQARTLIHVRPPLNSRESWMRDVVATRCISSSKDSDLTGDGCISILPTGSPSTCRIGPIVCPGDDGSSGNKLDALTLSSSNGIPAFRASRTIQLRAMSLSGLSSPSLSVQPGGHLSVPILGDRSTCGILTSPDVTVLSGKPKLEDILSIFVINIAILIPVVAVHVSHGL